MNEQKQWVTVEEAAPVLDMTMPQIYRAIRENKFPFRFVRFGRTIRINAADIGVGKAAAETKDQARVVAA
jgi:excisionase family DNA binding protein